MTDPDPVEVLEESLKDDSNTAERLKTIGHLKVIAKVIGPEKTKNNLFPLLHRHCFKDDRFRRDVSEEDLTEIARCLDSEFLKIAQTEKIVLDLLEKISAAEETVIRDCVGESLCDCLNSMSKASVKKVGLPLFKRLMDGVFGQRIMAINIFSTLLPKLEKKKEMLDLYKKLIRDEMPMVRSNAFRKLPELVEACDSKFYMSHCRLFLHHLSNEVSPGLAKLSLVKIILTLIKTQSKQGVSPEEIQQRTWTWLEKNR